MARYSKLAKQIDNAHKLRRANIIEKITSRYREAKVHRLINGHFKVIGRNKGEELYRNLGTYRDFDQANNVKYNYLNDVCQRSWVAGKVPKPDRKVMYGDRDYGDYGDGGELGLRVELIGNGELGKIDKACDWDCDADELFNDLE